MDNSTAALAQIECYTTRSPATNVTWMRNGELLTIDGVKYDAMQIVTDRVNSSYRNILVVNDVLSIVGNLTFSCIISNLNGNTSLDIPTNVTGNVYVKIIIVFINRYNFLIQLYQLLVLLQRRSLFMKVTLLFCNVREVFIQ